MRELFRTINATNNRSIADNFRCDIEIDVLSHPISSVAANPNAANPGEQDDHVAMRFKVYNAWISSLAYSDLNAGDNAIFVEQINLVHEGFEVNWGTDLTKAGSAKPF
jgi:phage tail-like protein